MNVDQWISNREVQFSKWTNIELMEIFYEWASKENFINEESYFNDELKKLFMIKWITRIHDQYQQLYDKNVQKKNKWIAMIHL